MPTNNSWSDVIPTDDDETLEQHTETWGYQMQAFGEIDLTKVGFSHQTRSVVATKFNNGQDQVDVRFFLLRNEDGLLICIHAAYLSNGVETSWYILTHPDHLRQGHMTRLAEYVTALREQETGSDFPYVEAWHGPMTNACASWVNKYVNAKLNSTP